MIDRRYFLKTTGLALVGGGFLPNVFVRMAAAGTNGGKKILVAVFQRGAVDGLNVVIPYAEPAYYRARPSIAIPRPGGGDGAALDLDGFFGLHPAMSPLLPYFKDRSAAFVHAAGSPDPTRSHFDAQDFMELGTPGRKSTPDGFLARAINARTAKESSPLSAVSLTPSLPRILSGSSEAVSMRSISDFGLKGSSGVVSESLESMYQNAVANPFAGAAAESFEAMEILRKTSPEKLAPANGATYPRSPFGNSLKQIAQLIKANVGLEIAFADVGGWDTHAGQGGSQGQLANRLRDYSSAIAAFARDLGSRMSDVLLVTMSEFGRTVKENGNRGTDHGHANVMLLLGSGVRGGEVYGKWPGLNDGALFENRDLAVTTDYRDVFAEVLTKNQGVKNLSAVFPGHDVSASRWRGLLS